MEIIIEEVTDYQHLLNKNSLQIWFKENLIYKDQFGRKFRLEPVKNLNIQMPFRIVPLPKDDNND